MTRRLGHLADSPHDTTHKIEESFEYAFLQLDYIGKLLKSSKEHHANYKQDKELYFQALESELFCRKQLNELGLCDSDSDDSTDDEDVFNDADDEQYEKNIRQQFREYENGLHRVIVNLAIKKTQSIDGTCSQ